MKNILSTITNVNLKKVSLGFLGVAIFVLVGYNAKDLIFGVPFKITTALDGSTVYDTFLPIRGESGHAREISINGRLIGVDKEGVFADGVLLSPGYNVVEVSLKDQFGNRKIKQYRIVVEPKEETVAQNSPSDEKGIINNL
jgi:hypothetical protein